MLSKLLLDQFNFVGSDVDVANFKNFRRFSIGENRELAVVVIDVFFELQDSLSQQQ